MRILPLCTVILCAFLAGCVSSGKTMLPPDRQAQFAADVMAIDTYIDRGQEAFDKADEAARQGDEATEALYLHQVEAWAEKAIRGYEKNIANVADYHFIEPNDLYLYAACDIPRRIATLSVKGYTRVKLPDVCYTRY